MDRSNRTKDCIDRWTKGVHRRIEKSNQFAEGWITIEDIFAESRNLLNLFFICFAANQGRNRWSISSSGVLSRTSTSTGIDGW